MRFQVLGELLVVDAGRNIAIPGQKQRLLLAVLLSRPGKTISTDHLTEVVWPKNQPKDARKRLAWHVHKLRKILDDPARISTTDDGYSITVARTELDSLELEYHYRQARHAVERGNPQRAIDLYSAALRMWRGEPFGEFRSLEWFTEAAAALEQLHLDIAERHADVCIDIGHSEHVIGTLTSLVAQHPLRERFREQLMRSLHVSGRTSEALAVFRQGRRVLSSQLGVEPGERLQRLHKELLSPARVVDEGDKRPQLAPAELPAAPAALIGRTELVESIRRQLLCTNPASPVVCALSGIGGLGKSALALTVAHAVRDQFPDGQLYVDLLGGTPNAPSLSVSQVLVRLLRTLGTSVSGDFGIDELSAMFRTAVANKRLLLVLDNAKDSEQVKTLLPGDPGCAVIVSSRRIMDSLDAIQYQVDTLSENASVDLFRRLLGTDRVDADLESVRELAQLCGGLPLAVCLAAARLSTRPQWKISDFSTRLRQGNRLKQLSTSDRAVRASFDVSYQELADTTNGDRLRQVFRLLGLHFGPEFSVDVAAALVGSELDDVEADLDVLTEVRLLDNHTPGRYRMHDLIRLFAAELCEKNDSFADRDAAVVRTLDVYLAISRAATDVYSNDKIVRNELVGPQTGPSPQNFVDKNQVTTWLLQEYHNLLAATRASIKRKDPAGSYGAGIAAALAPILFDSFAFRQQRDLSEAGVAAAQTDPEIMANKYLLGRVQVIFDDFEAAERNLDDAARIVNTLDNYDTMTVSIMTPLAAVYRRTKRFDAAQQCLEHAIAAAEQLKNPHLETSTLGFLAILHESRGHHHAAIEAFQRALERARKAQNLTRSIAASLDGIGMSKMRIGEYEEAIKYTKEAHDLYTTTDASETLVHALCMWDHGLTLHAAGYINQAHNWFIKAADLTVKLGYFTQAERDAIASNQNPDTPPLFART